MRSSREERTPAPCPECGGTRVAARCTTTCPRREVCLTERPEVAFFPRSSPLQALVCTACGFTAFYATRPTKFMRERPSP
jgi:hypothetical protein